MSDEISRLSATARRAMAARHWSVVAERANQILELDPKSPEGYFLKGIGEKQRGEFAEAKVSLSQTLALVPDRYDAAIELANVHWLTQEHGQSAALLEQYASQLKSSPHYLNFAGEISARLGLHEVAFLLFEQADICQPNTARTQGNLASAAAKLGKFDLARTQYLALLERQPSHQRNHFELARLTTATDSAHVDQMKGILQRSGGPDTKNIFLLFALAKELEDLGQWGQAFDHLKQGNDAAAIAARKAGYSVEQDIAVLGEIENTCTAEWLSEDVEVLEMDATPIFVVGLPRTGTTLVERILSSHSRVESADETFFLEMAIKKGAGSDATGPVNREILKKAANGNAADILRKYQASIQYKLSGKSYFIEKYPFNFKYTGFILKALPNARVVFLDRKPMDACFAMYKQPYFPFSFDLDWIGAYYSAYHNLRKHWSSVLGNRVVTVGYEDLVSEPDQQIRQLLDRLELDFEQPCIDFHLQKSASATASFAQIRQKTHTGSVDKWVQWETRLHPLKSRLDSQGIDTKRYKTS